jgi:hypothetical protein
MDVLSASGFDDKIAWYENDGGQNFTPHTITTAADGAISVYAADVDGDGDTDVLSASAFDGKIAWYENVFLPDSSVAGRKLFYNRSAFDGSNASINVSDDAAITTDKTAYLPGAGLAVFGNVSSYSRGINGIMIDLAGGGDHELISLSTLASDFVFRVGNNNTPSSWAPAPIPNAVSARLGEGISGADRVVITWADGAIKNQWLEVQVLPTSRTGLTATDVFFWGNKIGDIGSPTATSFTTTAAGDANPIVAGGLGPAGGITNPRDIDRSNTITAAGDRNPAAGNIGSITRINIGTGGPFAPEGDDDETAAASSGNFGIAAALAAPAPAEILARPLPLSVRQRPDRSDSVRSQVAACFEQWADKGFDAGGYEAEDELEELLAALAAR